ncbi:hypothetical protein PoB_000656300, partial [Plakobranchus ocellatus]
MCTLNGGDRRKEREMNIFGPASIYMESCHSIPAPSFLAVFREWENGNALKFVGLGSMPCHSPVYMTGSNNGKLVLLADEREILSHGWFRSVG